MLIKVCGMNELAKIKEIQEMDVDLVGFIFHPNSPRNMTIEPESLELNNSNGIDRVGVFVNASYDEISQRINQYKLNVIQLHGDEGNDLCEKLQSPDMKIVKAFSVDNNFKFEKIIDYPSIDYALFDTKGDNRGGNGTKFNWELLANYTGEKPFILSGGIGPEDAKQTIQLFNKLDKMKGIDINSRFEITPGNKDMKLLESFIKEIRNGISN